MTEGIRPGDPYQKTLEQRQYEESNLNLRARQELDEQCAVRYVNFYDVALRAIASERPRTVVDVGCSDGLLFAEAALANNLSAQLIGVDPFHKPYENVRDLFPPVAFTFQEGRAEQLPLPDNYADALLMLKMIYHTDSPGKALEEAARVLIQNGIGALSTNSNRHKPRHSDFESRIVAYLASLDKSFKYVSQPNFARRFSTERALQILPQRFQIIPGPDPANPHIFEQQVTEYHVTKEQWPIYRRSLESKRESLDYFVRPSTWFHAIATVVEPVVMAEIETKEAELRTAGNNDPGYFTDHSSRQLLLWRNLPSAA